MPVSLNLLIISVPLVLISLLLLRSSLFPRRTGSDPHCRRCDYLLAGLTSANCPECGNPIHPDGTVVGARHRKPIRLLIALPLLAISLALMLPRTARLLDDCNWQRAAPAWYHLRDARTPFAPGAPAAFYELTHRAATGALSAEQTRELVSLLLARHAKHVEHLDQIYAGGLLTRLYLARVLSSAEQQQFLRQSVSASLRVRQPVLAGDPVPYRVDQLVPTSPFWGEVYAVAWQMDDGAPVTLPDIRHTTDSSPTGVARPTTPGPHTLSVTVATDIYDGPFRDPMRSRLVFNERRTVSADFTVLPSAPPAYLQPIHAPELGEAIKKSMSISAGVDPDYAVRAQVAINSPPAPVAFDVYLLTGAKSEQRLGAIHCERAEYAWFDLYAKSIVPTPAPPYRIVLRPSRDVARLSLDLTQYWDGGPITLDDVPDFSY